MKMKLLPYLLFITLVSTLLFACQANSHASIDLENWKDNTNQLLKISMKRDGSYAYGSSRIISQPDLHSTYYALKTREHLDMPLTEGEKNALQTWLMGLLEEGRFVSDEMFGDTIGELYYGTTILTMTGGTIPQQQEIAEKINALQLPDGSYAFHKSLIETYTPGDIPFDSSLLTVVQATTVLNSINAPILQQDKLVTWLNDGWDENLTQDHPDLWKILLLLDIYNKVDPDNPRVSDPSTVKLVKEHLESYQEPDYPFNDNTLLDLNVAVSVAEKLNIRSEEWYSQHLLAQLKLRQNLDGGFNLFLRDDSEWTGIEAASHVFSYFNTSFDRMAFANLISAYQNPNTRGYFQIVVLESDIYSTWGALQTAYSLNLTLPNNIETTEQYVKAVWDNGKEPRQLYYAHLSADLLTLPLTNTNSQQELLLGTLENLTVETKEDISNLYYTVAVLRKSGISLPSALTQSIITELDRYYMPGVGYQFEGKPDIILTAKIILIFHYLDQPLPTEVITWLESQNQAQGYFTTTEHPLLPETYAAVLALTTIEGKLPPDKEQLGTWIQAHFVPSGGAIPTLIDYSNPDDGSLDMAALALKTLDLLGEDLK